MLRVYADRTRVGGSKKVGVAAEDCLTYFMNHWGPYQDKITVLLSLDRHRRRGP